MNNIIDIAEKIYLAGKQVGFGYKRTINIAFTIFNEKPGFIINRFTIQFQSAESIYVLLDYQWRDH
jgi:hypothetical protein